MCGVAVLLLRLCEQVWSLKTDPDLGWGGADLWLVEVGSSLLGPHVGEGWGQGCLLCLDGSRSLEFTF